MKHLLTLALLFSSTPISFAQPAADNAPKAANPANTDGAAAIQQATERMLRMTPAQRQELMRVTQEQMLRANFTQAGFADVPLQNAVLAFVAEQEKSRQKVRQAASQLNAALLRPTTDDAALSALMENYFQMAQDAKTQRETATKALDAAISFSAKPRLLALLTLRGIIGDASGFTGDVLMSGMMSMGTALTIR